MSVTLKEVKRDDLKPLFQLKVAPEQQQFIAATEFSLAQVHYEKGATPYVIWHDNIRVGLMLIIDMRECQHRDPEDDPNAIYLWRLLIGADFQGKGHGTAAMTALFKLTHETGLTKIETSTMTTNQGALHFYNKLGFTRTGIIIDNEVQLAKELGPHL